ncbi:5344_t:CDS:2, partial [Racocetra fulgida]
SDINRLEVIWKKKEQKPLHDATNTILVQDDGQEDEGSSKKKKEIGAASLFGKKEDAENGVLISSKVHTVLEIK